MGDSFGRMESRRLDPLHRLRERAELAIARGHDLETQLPEEVNVLDALHLIEELRIYQAELELQNEELRDAQSETAKALEKYRALFDNLPLPGLLANGDGDILEANARALDWMGEPGPRLTPGRRSVLQLLDDVSQAPLYQVLRDRSGNEPQVLERLGLRRFDGRILPGDVLIMHLRGEEAAEERSLLVLVDRGAEQALAESEARYRRESQRLAEVIWGTDIGTWEWNVQSGEVVFNERWASLLGYSLSELQPISIQTWIRLAHPDDLAESNARLQRCFSGESDFYEAECRMRHRDGHWLWVLDRGRIVERLSDGRPLRMSGTHQDVTARRLQEERLRAATQAAEAANVAKSAFLANMSHEIRTPMTAVLGLAHLLLDTGLDSRQRDYLHRLQTAAGGLLDLLNDILDYSKIEAGHLTLESVPLRIEELLDYVRNLFAQSAIERNLTLDIAPAPDLPAGLRGDPLRLRQVLHNLVGNALKFTEHGGVQVRVKSVPDADSRHLRLRVLVKDTGIGLTDVQREELFQPFHQADVSVTRRYGGTGLGLSISRRLVELMGGTLGVDSRAGVGSIFWFEVPLEVGLPAGADSDARPGIAATRTGTDINDQKAVLARLTAPIRGARLLLAEDHPTNRLIVGAYLKWMGLEFDAVENGAEALAQAIRERYDAILMDVQMPEMDGLTATRAIRAHPSGLNMPILALTAGALTADRVACAEAGMNDHIAKPIDPMALARALLHWIPARAAD